MQSYLFQTFSILIIASLILIHIPKSFCQDQQYATCDEPFQCGNLAFTYPFWGGSRPISCGYPGFELTCQDSVAFLASESVRYRVLAINGSRQSLTLSRDDLWDDLCPRFFDNTTFNYNIFRYSAGFKTVTLSYNCTIRDPNKPRQQPNQFDCPGNATTSTASFFTTATFDFNRTAIECSSAISVPINEAAIQNLGNSSALQAALHDGFDMEWVTNSSVCDECNRSGGRCGYNSTTSSFLCFCSDRPYTLTCDNTRIESGKSKRRIFRAAVLGLVIPFGTIGLTLSVAGAYYLVKRCSSCEGMIWWRSNRQKHQNVEAFIRSYNGSLAPKCYSFSEIKGMTYSFANQLGQGGYGSVYKGKLSDGRQVAVKVLKGNKGNGEDFINEVDSISRTSHVNVVTLLGFCHEANKRALVYDFMSNGSLDKFICRNESQGTDCRLEWEVLYKIALGTARGLEYLHQGCNTRIVHFDIKPQNILLDDDFCPKISDFGLAKLCKKKQSILSTIGARGTVGYIAPEVVFREFGGVSHKSDVYSYGMMVLEMVGLKSRIQVDTDKSSETYFPNWIHERLEVGKDLGLEGIKNVEEEETAMKIILVGLWCIQTKPSDRPSMSKVVEMLESSVQSLQLPAKPSLLEYSPAARMDSLVHSLSAAEEAVGGLENGASSGGCTLSGSQAED